MAEWIENKYKGKKGYIPNMKIDGTQEWSMVKVFGKRPPYQIEDFDTLCPRTKLFGKCVEGKEFCGRCGTLTPNVPMSHHKSCECYLEGEQNYPEETFPLGICPECNTDEYSTLSIDSCRALGVSEISCSECTFILQEKCCEEDLTKLFKGEK